MHELRDYLWGSYDYYFISEGRKSKALEEIMELLKEEDYNLDEIFKKYNDLTDLETQCIDEALESRFCYIHDC